MELDLLRRVTGGAKGRGAQTRSLMKEDRYTPRARTNTSLKKVGSPLAFRITCDKFVKHTLVRTLGIQRRKKSVVQS